KRRNEAYAEAAQSDRAKGTISSRWLSYQLGETLDPEVIMTHELCDSSGFNRSQPGTLIGTGGSSIGWAAGAAVGAKVAAGGRQRRVRREGDGPGRGGTGHQARAGRDKAGRAGGAGHLDAEARYKRGLARL